MNENRMMLVYLASLGIARMWLAFNAASHSLMWNVRMEGIGDQDALLKLQPRELKGMAVQEFIFKYGKRLIMELWPDIEKAEATIHGTIEIAPGDEVPLEMTLNVANFVPFKYRLNDADCLVPYKKITQEPLIALEFSLPEEEQ